MARGKAKYSDNQIITMGNVDSGWFDDCIQISLNRFAWFVARSYLATQAKSRTVYNMASHQGYYETPDDNEFDQIELAIDNALACDVGECAEENFMIGEIKIYPSLFIPGGWMICNGNGFDPDDYPTLYSILGFTFGSDAGLPRVPNLKDKFVSGVSATSNVGNTGGLSSVTLTEAQIPPHYHITGRSSGKVFGVPTGTAHAPVFDPSYHTPANVPSSTVGGGGSHENRPPYLTLVYMIYAGNVGD